jgi:protochlorophyllide reductase
MGMPDNSYVVMKLELGSLQSVRDFVANLKAFKSARPLNNLICNAAVYRPTDPKPAWTDDGFEMSMVSAPVIVANDYLRSIDL